MSISEQINSQIRLLRSLSFECHCQWKEELEFALSDAANTIESLMQKLADMEQSAEDCSGGWIECENKMPEIGKPVLVCDKQGNVCVRAITCEIKGKKYWSQDKYDVVAWQPLPEPYHEP